MLDASADAEVDPGSRPRCWKPARKRESTLMLDPVDLISLHTRAMLTSSPRGRRVDKELDAFESLDRCGDELVIVVDEDWTHRVVNPRALAPRWAPNVVD